MEKGSGERKRKTEGWGGEHEADFDATIEEQHILSVSVE